MDKSGSLEPTERAAALASIGKKEAIPKITEDANGRRSQEVL
jgi:hypothetical protein